MGGGVDVLSGGDGNDTFEIAEGSDVSSGINLWWRRDRHTVDNVYERFFIGFPIQ